MKRLIVLFLALTVLPPPIVSQDYIEHITNPMYGTDNSAGYYCGYPTYFPMTNDTLRALVIFANYPNGYWDPYTSNSNLIYMQYWPGTNQQHLQKPSWADSVICPTTNNVWHPSLTGLLASGVYFCRFESGDLVSVRQIILLK